MTELQVQGVALIAMLVSLPLVSWGSTGNIMALMIIGAVLLIASLVSLTVLRYVELKEKT